MPLFSERRALPDALLASISVVMLTGLGLGAYFDATTPPPSRYAERYAISASLAAQQYAAVQGFSRQPHVVEPVAISTAMAVAFPAGDSSMAGQGMRAIAYGKSSRSDPLRLRLEGLGRDACEAMIDFAVSGRASQAGVVVTVINGQTDAPRRCLPRGNTVDTFWQHGPSADDSRVAQR